jgi:hypothetical protein
MMGVLLSATSCRSPAEQRLERCGQLRALRLRPRAGPGHLSRAGRSAGLNSSCESINILCMASSTLHGIAAAGPLQASEAGHLTFTRSRSIRATSCSVAARTRSSMLLSTCMRRATAQRGLWSSVAKCEYSGWHFPGGTARAVSAKKATLYARNTISDSPGAAQEAAQEGGRELPTAAARAQRLRLVYAHTAVTADCLVRFATTGARPPCGASCRVSAGKPLAATRKPQVRARSVLRQPELRIAAMLSSRGCTSGSTVQGTRCPRRGCGAGGAGDALQRDGR